LKRWFLAWAMAISVLALGCATTSPLSNFADSMHRGNDLLMEGKYPAALESFQEANRVSPSAGALAFAAMAAYKMKDIPLADSYLTQAQALSPDDVVVCIILGYRSLVRFSQGDQARGRRELATYITAYKHLLPGSAGIRDAELLAASGSIDTLRLQQSIDRQIQELPINYDKMGRDAGVRDRQGL
jgi:tetratricopeptide (TPR) repeat protein